MDVLPDRELSDIASDENSLDLKKVMATGAECIRLFLKKNPDAELQIRANTPEKNRLYRIIIARELSSIEAKNGCLPIQGFRLLSKKKWRLPGSLLETEGWKDFALQNASLLQKLPHIPLRHQLKRNQNFLFKRLFPSHSACIPTLRVSI
nr:hypothetical protein [Dyadobacter beijingensis]